MRLWSRGRFVVCLAFVAGFAALAALDARATTIVVPTDAELLAASRAVIEGRVVDITSRRTDGGRSIFTYVTIDVTRTLAGDVDDNRIVLKEFGGFVGNDFSIVYGTPEYAVGERVLVYLNTDDDGALHTAFMMIGKFSIVTDGGRDYAVRRSAAEAVSVLPPLSDGSVTDRAPLDEYAGAVTGRALAADVSRAARAPYRPVPEEFALPVVPGDETHHEQFTLISYHARWFEPDEGIHVPYYYRPTSFLLDGGQGAVADALAAWSTVEGCSLRLYLADDTELCGYSRDGLSVVSFDDCKGQVDGGGCFGVIAIGGASGRSDEHKTVNGVDFVRITEGDVVMNNGQQTCLLGHRLTIREVLTHEIGHSIGLGHSSDIGPEPNPRLKEATMYYALHEDDRGASLKPDDIDGVRFIYPDSLRPPEIVTESLPGATTGAAYEIALTAEGGEPPYSWQVTSGTLPEGLGLATTGVLSGTPATRGSSIFTLLVTDAHGRTGSRDFAIDVTGPKPVISGALYRASKSRLEIGVGSLDATELEIRVNGVTVAPPARIKRKPTGTGGTQLRVKGSASDLHVSATAGANSVVVVADGVASDPFAF